MPVITKLQTICRLELLRHNIKISQYGTGLIGLKLSGIFYYILILLKAVSAWISLHINGYMQRVINNCVIIKIVCI